jgi:uncharacterized protein
VLASLRLLGAYIALVADGEPLPVTYGERLQGNIYLATAIRRILRMWNSFAAIRLRCREYRDREHLMSNADLALSGKKQATPSPVRGQSVVVSVIRHTVIPGKDQEYEAWLREIASIAGNAEGHRGMNLVRPHTGSRTYTIVLHFDRLEHLEHWLASGVWKRLILKVQDLLQDGEEIEIKTGLEFWFRPPDSEQKRAKPYKQCLITLSVIFPLTMLVPWLLTPLFHAAPVLGMSGITHFLVAGIIVALMTYVIMPRYTRFMAAWLYR